ncbi:MAG: addiction module protein [Verrucomicrobiota bacterium]
MSIDTVRYRQYHSYMNSPTEKIVTEALALNVQARAFIAEKLLESLDLEPSPEISPEWQAEVKRRCAGIDHESVELIEADEVFRNAFAAQK